MRSSRPAFPGASRSSLARTGPHPRPTHTDRTIDVQSEKGRVFSSFGPRRPTGGHRSPQEQRLRVGCSRVRTVACRCMLEITITGRHSRARRGEDDGLLTGVSQGEAPLYPGTTVRYSAIWVHCMQDHGCLTPSPSLHYNTAERDRSNLAVLHPDRWMCMEGWE
jgi:hypothetical protein